MGNFILTSAIPGPKFQQPPTSSGVEPPLDWAIFISLLFFIVAVGFRQIIKSDSADQKVLERLIQELLATNRANSDKLAEISAALSLKQAEEASIIFRVRSSEQKIEALHRRLDLSGTPHSSDKS